MSIARKTSQIKAMQRQAGAIQRVNNEAIIPQMATSRASIMRANAILQEQGLILEEDRSKYTTKALARRFLENLNCTQVNLGSNYSLVAAPNTPNKISNPAIVDPANDKQTNRQISTNRSFSEKCDPFYELDDPMSHDKKERIQKDAKGFTPDLTMTANFIAQINAEGISVRLKQFKDPQATRRSEY